MAKACTTSLPLIPNQDVPRDPRFQPYLERWLLNRKKRGNAWRIDHDRVVGGPIDFCDRCEHLGHEEKNCPTLVKCLHCGGPHTSLSCTSNPFAVLGEEGMDEGQ